MTPAEAQTLRRLLEAIAHLCESALEVLAEKPAEPEQEPRKPRFLGDDDAEG